VSNLTVTLILVVRKAVSLVISLRGKILADRAARSLGVQEALSAHPALEAGWDAVGGVLKAAVGVDEAQVQGLLRTPLVEEKMMWTGAGLVLLGTVGYTLGTNLSKKTVKAKKE